jgi:Asp/Glu/hydantoin racemase
MRILLLNPNSSEAMTNGMVLAANSTPISDV